MSLVYKPHLPAGCSYHVQGCAPGQYNGLHGDVDGSFVQIPGEVPATPAQQRASSNTCNIKVV